MTTKTKALVPTVQPADSMDARTSEAQTREALAKVIEALRPLNIYRIDRVLRCAREFYS